MGNYKPYLYDDFKDFDRSFFDAAEPLVRKLGCGKYKWTEVVRYLKSEIIKRAWEESDGNQRMMADLTGMSYNGLRRNLYIFRKRNNAERPAPR